jgi:hypothetical protein
MTPDAPLARGSRLHPREGFTLRVPDYAVASGDEAEDCYFFAVPDLRHGAPLYVSAFAIETNDRDTTPPRSSSHHTNVYRVGPVTSLYAPPGGKVVGGQCANQGAVGMWPLVVNVQGQPSLRWELPAGTAQRFMPGEQLMIQTHYLNATRALIHAQVAVAFELSTAPHPIEVGAKMASHTGVRVCETPTARRSYRMRCRLGGQTPVDLVAANGHFHARGREFSMFTTGPEGDEPFYRSIDFTHPRFEIGLDRRIAPGLDVAFSCSYEWVDPAPLACAQLDADNSSTDCCYTYGPKPEENEHCIAFLYYYPRVPDGDFVCVPDDDHADGSPSPLRAGADRAAASSASASHFASVLASTPSRSAVRPR